MEPGYLQLRDPRDPDRGCKAFYDLASKVQVSLLSHSASQKLVTRPAHTEEERTLNVGKQQEAKLIGGHLWSLATTIQMGGGRRTDLPCPASASLSELDLWL